MAFLAGDRVMGDCVDLSLVVEGISLGEYLMFSNEISPKLWDKSKNPWLVLTILLPCAYS